MTQIQLVFLFVSSSASCPRDLSLRALKSRKKGEKRVKKYKSARKNFFSPFFLLPASYTTIVISSKKTAATRLGFFSREGIISLLLVYEEEKNLCRLKPEMFSLVGRTFLFFIQRQQKKSEFTEYTTVAAEEKA